VVYLRPSVLLTLLSPDRQKPTQPASASIRHQEITGIEGLSALGINNAPPSYLTESPEPSLLPPCHLLYHESTKLPGCNGKETESPQGAMQAKQVLLLSLGSIYQ
jgi:hypothetical protein